jgi:hypothetical protein
MAAKPAYMIVRIDHPSFLLLAENEGRYARKFTEKLRLCDL